MKLVNHILLNILLFAIVGCHSEKKSQNPITRFFENDNTLVQNINKLKPLRYENERTEVIKIDFDVIEKQLNLEEIIDTIRFTTLETNSECIIGNIDKTIIVDSLIFLMDNRNSKSIYIFDLEGNYYSKINNMGKGPDQYFHISTFSVERKDKLVVVPDLMRARLLYYSYRGKFIKEKKCNFRFSEIACVDNLNFYYLHNSHNQHILPEAKDKVLFAIDSLGQLKYQIDELVPNDLNYGISPQMIEYSDKILLSPPITSNTIFELREDTAFAKYFIDFGKYQLPDGFAEGINSDDFTTKYKDSKYCYFLGENYESKSYLYFKFIKGNSYIYTFYNKVSKSQKTYYSMVNIKQGQLNSFPKIIGVIPSSDTFVGLLQPFDLTRTSSGYLKKIGLNKIDDTDNPILCFFKLK